MVLELKIILMLVWMHTIMDFVFQTQEMSTNKSSSNKWLSYHVLVYTIPFLFIDLTFGLINGALHFAIDYVTSRMTTKLYAKGEIHNFFVVVGIDQALHFTCLFATYIWLVQ